MCLVAKKSHCQARVFVCVSNNRADTVDWLLIENYLHSSIKGTRSPLKHCLLLVKNMMNYTLLTSLEHSKTMYTLKGHEVFMMSIGV